MLWTRDGRHWLRTPVGGLLHTSGGRTVDRPGSPTNRAFTWFFVIVAGNLCLPAKANSHAWMIRVIKTNFVEVVLVTLFKHNFYSPI